MLRFKLTQNDSIAFDWGLRDSGKLYVATCNLEGPLARKPTCIVCIGGK